jgi:hypothetical protein
LNGIFKNKWSASGGFRWIEAPVDTRLMRGGPALKQDAFLCTNAELRSDVSRRLGGSTAAHGHFHNEGLSRQSDFNVNTWARPMRAMQISASVYYGTNIDDLQYVSTAQTNVGQRYVLGRIDQRTWSLTLRVNWTITPKITLQYYGSPFFSTGRYDHFKSVRETQAPEYADRFRSYALNETSYRVKDNAYDIVEPGGAAFSFDGPDFSFRQFRSNLVLRWEYKPGSSLYVVWAQGRTGTSPISERGLGTNWNVLWSSQADNVFLVKFSYWLAP